MSDEKSQEPGGGRLLPEVQWVDNAEADVICPLCHQKMVKVNGQARGVAAVPKNAEYIRGWAAMAACRTCDVIQQWSFTRGAGTEAPNERFLDGRAHTRDLVAELNKDLTWTKTEELKDILLGILRDDLDPQFLAGVRSYLKNDDAP